MFGLNDRVLRSFGSFASEVDAFGAATTPNSNRLCWCESQRSIFLVLPVTSEWTVTESIAPTNLPSASQASQTRIFFSIGWPSFGGVGEALSAGGEGSAGV